MPAPLAYAIAVFLGAMLGYWICLGRTWMQVYQVDSKVRALAVDIGVLVDMNDEVPPEWVLEQLDRITGRNTWNAER